MPYGAMRCLCRSNTAATIVTSVCASSSTADPSRLVFDRRVKRLQRNMAAQRSDLDKCQYLKEEIAYRVADRVYDCTDFFPVALDLGCGLGAIASHVFKENVGVLVQMDMSAGLLNRAAKSPEVPTYRLIADEETPPLRAGSANLIVTSLAMHWINDLPGFFRRCFDSLEPDGGFIGAMFAGDTLYELRCSLQLAEMERHGRLTSHVSPFVQASDLGGLMSAAGFGSITLDRDEICVAYPDMVALMDDLQAMGENGCAYTRPTHLRRDVLTAAAATYQAMYGNEDGSIPATYDILYVIGWKPGAKMPRPARRGSATASFKDIGTITGGTGQS